MSRILNIASALASLCLTFSLAAFPAQGATTSWQSVQGGAVRVITAGPAENGTYKLGLEFSLDPGWHTYWRFPGEAGIPPSLDFSGSGNLDETEVLFPVPERYSDGFSSSIVYHDAVVLPIIAKPEDNGSTIDLSLSVFFGICSNICVPGDATFSVRLDPSSAPDPLSARLIERDLALVPKRQSSAPPHVTEVNLATPGKDGTLEITANLGNGKPDLFDLFAEGPEGSFIALPKLAAQSEDTATWHLSAKGLQFPEDTGDLRLVLVVDGAGYESTHELRAADFD